MGRKFELGKWGGVAIALMAVAAVLWPEKADVLTKLGAALAGLLAAVAAAIGYEDAQQAKAKSEVEAAAHYARAGKGENSFVEIV